MQMCIRLVRPPGNRSPIYDALGKLGKALKSGIDIRNCLLEAAKCLRSFFLSPHERLDKGIQGSEHTPVLAEPQVKLGYQISRCTRYALFSRTRARRNNAFSIR